MYVPMIPQFELYNDDPPTTGNDVFVTRDRDSLLN